LLGEILGHPACSYTDLEAGLTTVTSFLGSKDVWSETTRKKLRAHLRRINDCGLFVGRGQISFRKVQSQDWAQAWKHHFKPFRIGSALLVRPSWSRLRTPGGQRVVVLDPGLSFGTGHHPTTRFCLEQLVTHRRSDQRQSFLDLGTGSGILAIAAAKVGYAPVLALDFDRDAVAIARDNARRNRIAGRIVFRRRDISKLALRVSTRYSVVCANLIAPLLFSQRARILAHLDKGGLLVLAGILESEFKSVRAAYEAEGLKMATWRVEKEWCSGSFAAEIDS
jgi:ribosomal protein L11 methyltransferase